jgi:tetratricopeptide (TPR) repeat protein
MRQATCSQCGLTTTVRSFYSMNGKTYCEPCVWKAAREAKEAGEPAEYVALQDNSICGRCGAYSGDTADHPIVGKIPLCATCAPQVSNWPYPTWLKAGLAALLLLLVVALVHGRHYFHAGRTMYIGERLVEEKRYEQALPYLQETLRIAPESDKTVLLTAKAALEIGDIDTADKAIQGHNAGHFQDADNRDFQEVKQMWDRATAAFEKAGQAAKLEQQDGQAAEAARLMHEAASMYPEARGLAIAAEGSDEGVAFEARDYDKFLAIAEKQWQEYPSAGMAATVASALACKYAVTGDPKYRQEAEQMLETSRQKVGTGPEEQKSFQEYTERIRYRLDSRQIISKAEYDRKFRHGQVAAQ